VLLISDNRAELSKYYDFVLPNKPVVDFLMDKTAFYLWAQKHEFPVPESYVVQSESQLMHVLGDIEYPIVIKPIFRTRDWQMKSPVHKIYKLHCEREIALIDFNLFEAAPRFLIQRWIPGGDANVHFCLIYLDRDGKELGYYTGRKLLQWPMLTGSTAMCVGTNNNDLHILTKDVLGKAELRGLGSLEVKQNEKDGKYYITEPTVGRNNLQSFVAVAGGVNLTKIALYDAINKKIVDQGTHRRKAIWIEEYFVLQCIYNNFWQMELAPKKIITELNWRIAFSHLSLRDPVPFIVLCKEMLHRMTRKVFAHFG
jgi:predicted ATP-grasp superfamily ATP-dependent carboligase